MTEVLPRTAPVPVVGPVHIPTVSWFEFILNESLLEKHLSLPNPDPSAGQLICDFLLQANRQITQLQFLGQSTDDLSVFPSNIKIQTLKLLALKVAAFFKWDLNTIEKNVPNGIVQSLLLEFRATTNPDGELNTVIPEDSVRQVSDTYLFSLQLYHRWCLRTIVKNSFTMKPAVKTGFISAPDFGNNRLYGDNIKAVNYAELSENAGISATFLENCLRCERQLVVPTMNSIGIATEKFEIISHNWSKGTTVSAEELKHHILYDLAAYYFYKEDYKRALELFTDVKIYHNTVDHVIGKVDTARLDGYYAAVTHLIPVDRHTAALSTRERVEISKRNDYEGLCEILLEDNISQNLTISHRTEIEEDIVEKLSNKPDIVFKVRICNLVRKVQEGHVVLADLTDQLEHNIENCKFLIETIERSLACNDSLWSSNLKCFIWNLINCLSPRCQFTKLLTDTGLKSYFENDGDFCDITSLDNTDMFINEFVHGMEELDTLKTILSDKLVGLGEVERQLLCTNEATRIETLIQQLIEKWHRRLHQITSLNDKWKLPRDLRYPVESLQNPILQAYTHVLIGKARYCMEMKMFDRARQLLQVAEAAVKDISYKLSKGIRWRITLVDIKEAYSNKSSVNPALAKKAKTCLTALRSNQDMQPPIEVLEHCVAYLLNIQDWEYICSLDNTRNNYIEFSRQIACVCKDISPPVPSSNSPRELWDSVVGIFVDTSNQSGFKRGQAYRGGQRDSPQPPPILTPDAFLNFVSKITDQRCLSLLISCLTKFYNIIRDDITTDIHSDYVNLWPTSTTSGATIDIPAVSDTLAELMHCVIQLEPTQASWLRTQADILFANGRHAPAMKFYLESGVVATDYFCEPITAAVYNDQVYHKMIKCCSYLKCHTQVAVLCQLLEEPDYTTCFSSLQERHTNDAMDTYYAYIWDISILEFLIYLHTKRGELSKKQSAMRAMSQLDLNSNNPDDILNQAINTRKRKFLKALSKQYL